MNFLIISPIGLSEFVLPRLSMDDRVKKVFFCVLDPAMKQVGSHAELHPDWVKVELISDYMKVIDQYPPSDLVVIIDDVGVGYLGKKLREMGYRVIGGSPMSDKIEDDRDFATNMMKTVMDVPETFSFSSFDEGMKFVKTQPQEDRFVFKPNDSQAPKEYTYVSKNIADLLQAMKDMKADWKWKESFQLQRFMPGMEMDFNAYFNGKDWLPNSLIYYFENKPVMNDDVGPATGGAIAVEYSRKNEGIFMDILNKLKPMLIKDNYVGQLAVNCIVSEVDKKPYFLEFCGRFGYPSFPADITLVEDNDKTVYDLFMAMADGTMPTLFPTNKVAVTVVVGIDPYPYKGNAEKNLQNAHELFESYDEKKGMVSAGIEGQLLQVTCADVKLDGAISMLYDDYMPTLKLKDKLYRTDCGKDAKRRMLTLKDWKVI